MAPNLFLKRLFHGDVFTLAFIYGLAFVAFVAKSEPAGSREQNSSLSVGKTAVWLWKDPDPVIQHHIFSTQPP